MRERGVIERGMRCVGGEIRGVRRVAIFACEMYVRGERVVWFVCLFVCLLVLWLLWLLRLLWLLWLLSLLFVVVCRCCCSPGGECSPRPPRA